MSSKYDIIIIGSGLGGLECGAILSKEGYNVCVLEKNALFGGCFQTYSRKGHLLDTGIHYVGSLDEGQVLNQCFHYFGIWNQLRLQRLDEDAFDQIRYNGTDYHYAMGYPRFVDTLAQAFPQEREAIGRYAEQLQAVGNLIGVEHLKQGIIAQRGIDYFCTPAAGLIADLTANPTLQNVLAGSGLLYGGLRERSSFYEHAMINHSYIEGAYRFVDGSMQVPLELIRTIRAHGGTVRNRSEVTRIIVEEERVKGVLVDGEERLESRFVISDMHPCRTLDTLDKCRSIKHAYTSRIHSLENTYGIFTLYLVMKERSLPYRNQNLYLHGADEVWYDKERGMGRTAHCMISMQASSTESEYASVVSILTPMYIDELSAWKDTLPEQRGESYQAFKRRKAEQLLHFLKGQGVDFGPYIAEMYSSTPLSYRDYTGTEEGSAYGIIKDYHCPQIGFVSTRSKLPNLFHTGQNLNVHGALGVTLTALLTCAEFVGGEYLAKKIGNA
ncbi:MAG: FAD-dependent oxidoreductase [Mediterranea sp.]|jgi:phytoene dehydrogenase-like protein|nr:FAD-dependent oxidoreductase [Mediterranea sp.]